MENNPNRRQVIKQVGIVVGGVATVLVLPGKWSKPVIEAIVGPALGDTLTQIQSVTFSQVGSTTNSIFQSQVLSQVQSGSTSPSSSSN